MVQETTNNYTGWQGAISCHVLGKYAVKHMTFQTWGRAQAVCKHWYDAFRPSLEKMPHLLKYRQDLLDYRLLVSPMFSRYIILLSLIDSTAAPKFMECYGQHVLIRGMVLVHQSQFEYEYAMLQFIADKATEGRWSSLRNFCNDWMWFLRSYKDLFNDFLNNLQDKNDLLAQAKILCMQYYRQPLLNPIQSLTSQSLASSRIIYKPELAFLFNIEDSLISLIEKEMAQFKTSSAYPAFSICRDLISRYNLLPNLSDL